MKAFQTAGPGENLVEKELPIPEPQGKQVLLKTLAAGVCHSDVHMHDGHFDLGNDRVLKVGGPDLTLGHEIFGEVVQVGPEVETTAIGDRRVAFPWIGCGGCALCRRGDGHLCAAGPILGVIQDGGFGEYVLVPDSRYLFDKGDSPDALSCTYACSGLTAFSALRKARARLHGGHLLIVGAGGVGMNAIQIARSAFGLRPMVVDIDDRKLEAAQSIGVEHVFNAGDAGALKAIGRLTEGGARVTIDFVGSEASSTFALRSLCKGGALIMVGLFGGTFKMPLPMIPILARTIEGSYVGSIDEMAELMSLVRDGRIPPIPVDERKASAAAAMQALADLRGGNVTGRVVLTY